MKTADNISCPTCNGSRCIRSPFDFGDTICPTCQPEAIVKNLTTRVVLGREVKVEPRIEAMNVMRRDKRYAKVLKILTGAIVLLLLATGIVSAEDDAPESFRVLEPKNESGETHFVVWGCFHSHGLCGILADVWAKTADDARSAARKKFGFPGTIICANQQRLKIVGLDVEQAGEWRLEGRDDHSPPVPRNRCTLTPAEQAALSMPGWVLDCRDEEDIKDKAEARSHIRIDRLRGSRK